MRNPAATNGITTDAAGLRAALCEAARHWGEVGITRSDALGRETRLNIRALAEVYGIPLVDHNDNGPNGPLTAGELARLPELRRQARANHRLGIWSFRAGRALRVFPELALFVRYDIGGWLVESSAIKALAVTAGLYVLLGIAFGFASPVGFSLYLYGWGLVAFHWVQHHPEENWLAARLCAGVTSAFLLFGLLFGFDVFDEPVRPRAPVPVPAPRPAPAPIRRYEIQNFHERSAFGDASLAEKEQVARALQGNQGSFAPKYED